MSGHIARTGFHYQDLYLLYRVLRDACDSLEEAWEKGLSDVLPILDKNGARYGIEASPRSPLDKGESGPTGSDWDVLVLALKRFEFAEVKSGAISKDDRLALWGRLRRELGRQPTEATNLVPVLVVDTNKAGDLTKWQGLAEAAFQFSGPAPSAEPTNNVLTAAQLLEEALWHLCKPSAAPDDPPVELAVAQGALARFELHCHEAQRLESTVSQLLELLFPGGLTETERVLLLGWLNDRAIIPTPERRLFSIRELLVDVKVLQHAASLAAGTLKEWRDLWNEVPQGFNARAHLQLGETGESLPAAKVQPAALAALTDTKTQSLVIIGSGGAGKSTFVAQAAQSRPPNDVTLSCGADVTLEELEKLIKAFRFRAAIVAIKNPDARACLFVDGLDEAESALRKRWGQLLVRLTALPNVFLMGSVREAVWNADGELRKELSTWTTVTLILWPETLIRDLLAPTPYHNILSPSVTELLRTPILLDLFWRTFIEAETQDVSLAARLQTRHNLLAAYWEHRLVHSPRHASISELSLRFGKLCSQVAGQIGPFLETGLDAEVLQALLSEGILVREGRLQPRVRFRHPLLRDFAFAQWCLAADSAAQVAARWNSICGRLQQYGALRSIFEALSDPGARGEYPRLDLASVILAVLRAETGSASQVAQVLGTHESSIELDPATWPAQVQSSLPTNFGGELLSAARLAGNGSWAPRLEHWPDDAAWLGNDYSNEIVSYLSTLLELRKRNPADGELRAQCRHVARRIRAISELARFDSDFAGSERWLKTQAMLCVIPTLPDDATFSWVEREMPVSNWRTRSFLMEQLIFLAEVDAGRTAAIYRQAVGLTRSNGVYTLKEPWQGAVFDHHVIEWSLAGEGERRGLLKEHPEAFLPVALELAEALWHEKADNRLDSRRGLTDIIKQFEPTWSEEKEAELEREREALLGGLFDDSAEWGYWRTFHDHDLHSRVLSAVHECAKRCAAGSMEGFCSSIAPILRSSRLVSVQSILLDVLLQGPQQLACQRRILECITDSRLYHASGIEYWLEQGLIAVWRFADASERAKLFEIIKSLLKTPGEEHNAKNFLLRLPIEDLPAELKNERPAEGDPKHQPYARPQRTDVMSFEGVPIAEDDERLIGKWPESFDRALLLRFHRSATTIITTEDAKAEGIRDQLPIAFEAARQLTAVLKKRRELLQDPTHGWVWQNLTRLLQRAHKVLGDKGAPPEELVRNCGDLAITELQDVPLRLPGDLKEDGLTYYSETPWTLALSLADVVLTWPPLANDQVVQDEFIKIVTKAFESGHPLVQLVCTTVIRSWHWFRDAERRLLHDRLVWQLPKHSSVLAQSLSRTGHYPDADRARVLRLLLDRNDVENPKHLAHWLGQYIGSGSMLVFPGGERSVVADLARDAFSRPENFGLLRDEVNRREFLRQFVWGMKEQAKHMSVNTELAGDYGNWALEIWRELLINRKRRGESESVVLLTLDWLEKKQRHQIQVATLKKWWENLQPLLNAVISEGGRPDCFTLFFSLHNGEFNDLTMPEALIRLGEIFAERIRKGVQDGTLNLDATNPKQQDFHSWRESAHFLAETIDSLRRDGSLQTDLQREQAHGLLSQLVAEPIRSVKAMEVLHRLQNE